MRFQITTQRPTHWDARIFFHGLLLLCPENSSNNTCDIGIASMPGHVFSIDVFKCEAHQPKSRLLRLSGPLKQTFEIKLSTPAAVDGFVTNPAQAFKRADINNDDYDLRWALNLHGDEFHRATKPKPIAADLHPGVHLMNGTLYAAALTDNRWRYERTGSSPIPIDRFATTIGASLMLAKNENLILKWGQGADEILELPRGEDRPGSKYVVYVDNSPPFVVPDPNNLCGDFPHYYHVVEPVPEQFDVCLKTMLRETTRVPCMSIFIDDTLI